MKSSYTYIINKYKVTNWFVAGKPIASTPPQAIIMSFDQISFKYRGLDLRMQYQLYI